MLPYLISTPDLEPETGRVGSVHLPYDILLKKLGRPNLESNELDAFVAWGFIGPGGGGFVLWGGDAVGLIGWELDEAECWSIGFSDDRAYGKENRELAQQVFGDALELEIRSPGRPASEVGSP